MFRYPTAIENLINSISKLQGIGRKTAERLVFNLYNWSPNELENLSTQISKLQIEVKECARCHNFAENKLCFICENQTRDNKLLCIIESPNEIKAIEESKCFNGYYHILGGKLSPLDEIGPEQLNIDSLLKTVKTYDVSEILMAISSDIEGEATSSYLTNLFKNENITITRLALGLPVGSELIYADSSTLAMAIKKRQAL